MEQDCSHCALDLYYLSFHSDQHGKGWTVCSTLLLLAFILHLAQVFVAVVLSYTVLQTLWNKNTAAKGTETGSCDCTQKSGRSQTTGLKQHYDSEAEVIYLGLFLSMQ